MCVAYGENMNVHVHKNRATSRSSRELNYQRRDVGIQRCNVPEATIFNIATLGSNVATFSRLTQI